MVTVAQEFATDTCFVFVKSLSYNMNVLCPSAGDGEATQWHIEKETKVLWSWLLNDSFEQHGTCPLNSECRDQVVPGARGLETKKNKVSCASAVCDTAQLEGFRDLCLWDNSVRGPLTWDSLQIGTQLLFLTSRGGFIQLKQDRNAEQVDLQAKISFSKQKGVRVFSPGFKSTSPRLDHWSDLLKVPSSGSPCALGPWCHATMSLQFLIWLLTWSSQGHVPVRPVSESWPSWIFFKSHFLHFLFSGLFVLRSSSRSPQTCPLNWGFLEVYSATLSETSHPMILAKRENVAPFAFLRVFILDYKRVLSCLDECVPNYWWSQRSPLGPFSLPQMVKSKNWSQVLVNGPFLVIFFFWETKWEMTVFFGFLKTKIIFMWGFVSCCSWLNSKFRWDWMSFGGSIFRNLCGPVVPSWYWISMNCFFSNRWVDGGFFPASMSKF